MRRCLSCGAEIVHATTPRGRSMPVDAMPNPAGNVTLTLEQGVLRANIRAIGTAAHAEAKAAGKLYMPHHATCPDAPAWRRRDVRIRERRAGA